MNRLGASGWQLTSVVNANDELLAYLQRDAFDSGVVSPLGWTLASLGTPWSRRATRHLPLTVGYLLDCLVKAAATAAEHDDPPRQGELSAVEQRVRADLERAAETIGGARPLPRAMKFDTVLDALAAVRIDQREDGAAEAAAATKELEQRLPDALELASGLLYGSRGREAAD